MYMSARELKKLIKVKDKQAKKEKIQRERNQKIDSKVIEYWLNKIKQKGERYFQCYTCYSEMENNDPMDLEVCNNFKAYQKAFAKLGYKLYKISDGEGCGWAIVF